jgi:hypothetical protein
MKKCPHCGGELSAPKSTGYSPEFLAFWKAYEASKLCPNASKKDAFKAWRQTEDERPADHILLRCLGAYRSFLTANPRNPVSACHPSVWLRQARYEGFLDKVSHDAPAPQLPRHGSWNGQAGRLIAQIGEASFTAWFAPCEIDDGPPVTIITDREFRRDWIMNHFAGQLRSAFGAFEVRLR